MIDKEYCMSSFLMFRTVADAKKAFVENTEKRSINDDIYKERKAIHSSEELEEYLKIRVRETCDQPTALALSGGIDSAILAKFMPKGSIAYTFKCVVPGKQVIDETAAAARYAKECGLEHRVIEIFWDDFEKYAPILMSNKNAPIHSIEVQIYKAFKTIMSDGINNIIFGENADAIYGGLSQLLSKNWHVGEFIDRYSYVMPYKVLKKGELILEPFINNTEDGMIDPHKFITDFFRVESLNSYLNAADTAGGNIIMPYAETYMAETIDYNRIRSGENKYWVREVFNRLYPDFEVPPKTPMPRPMNEWLENWSGPHREEFWPHCTDDLSGDQKWLIWSLETYLNMIDEQ